MLGFNMLTRFVLLSCVVAVCVAELNPKEEVSADQLEVKDNRVKLDEKAPKEDISTNDATEVELVGDIDALELADPIKSSEIAESIESALTGYDIVIGDPINVVNSGTVKDRGVKKQIFDYDPNDKKKLLQTSILSGCSSTEDATVISTVGKFRKQLDKEAKVSGSVSGSGFGVSASFAFSASTSSSEVEDHITQNKGSLTIFTMTCSSRHLDVGNTDVGMPPFTWKFANFITKTLGKVNPGRGNKREQKRMFKSLLSNYGTDYIEKATIGARVTTTNFLSQAMTSTMSQSKIKACASASAKVDYMAVSAEVSASGCSAKDQSKFNSRDTGVTKTVKNSYGTTKVARDGSKFSMDTIKEPRPISFTLAPIIDLFTPKALMYGIPANFADCGRNPDTDGRKRKALSKRILSWLEPMFKTGVFEKNYCEAFARELPDCGKTVSEKTKKKGCGYSGSCGAFEKCVDISRAPYYQCNKVGADRFLGKTVQIGYGSNCRLFWEGGSGNTHNAEFRCGSGGDKFWIRRKGDLYQIGYRNCPMYWKGGSSSTKNLEFRCGGSGDTFWIREQPKGMWAVGFNSSPTVFCPMFWKGGSGDKNAEVRCGRHISDVFWIKVVPYDASVMNQGKRDEPVEQDEPVLKPDEPVLKPDEPVLKQRDPVEALVEEFDEGEYVL